MIACGCPDACIEDHYYCRCDNLNCLARHMLEPRSFELNPSPGHTDPFHTCKACDWRLNAPPRPDLKDPSGPTEGELVDYEWRLRVRGA